MRNDFGGGTHRTRTQEIFSFFNFPSLLLPSLAFFPPAQAIMDYTSFYLANARFSLPPLSRFSLFCICIIRIYIYLGPPGSVSLLRETQSSSSLFPLSRASFALGVHAHAGLISGETQTLSEVEINDAGTGR